MEAFVGVSLVGGVKVYSASQSRVVCGVFSSSLYSVSSRNSSSRVVMMGGVDPAWKNELCGGFPGGEAFFKQWLAEGATGDVPALDESKQPKSDFAGEEEYEPIGSKRGQQKQLDPAWKTLFAGGIPGGETFYKRWVAQGTLGDVPNLDDELQPRANE
uniref:Uncharacterized protein n=1 Tax=Timspurckia oligopyrenoides TaxID=708627 RepID=A0A7S0ZES9_9RHOD|mmetsp:Transcript_2480/g.4361  ORF Transcript_2480/g.4361 Transcript_2480/m.4361 type:complete len:158 (+) Transcript_2480:45-518(+)